MAASTTILTLALCYFAIDGVVYRVAKAHIDAFWLQYLLTTFEGLGIGPAQIAGAVLALAVILALELFLLRTARRIRRRALWSVGLAVVCIVCFVVTQAIHIVAYEVSDTRFTSITPQLPFYFPMRSHRNAVKYGRQLALVRESEADASATEPRRCSIRCTMRAVACAPIGIARTCSSFSSRAGARMPWTP